MLVRGPFGSATAGVRVVGAPQTISASMALARNAFHFHSPRGLLRSFGETDAIAQIDESSQPWRSPAERKFRDSVVGLCTEPRPTLSSSKSRPAIRCDGIAMADEAGGTSARIWKNVHPVWTIHRVGEHGSPGGVRCLLVVHGGW